MNNKFNNKDFCNKTSDSIACDDGLSNTRRVTRNKNPININIININACVDYLKIRANGKFNPDDKFCQTLLEKLCLQNIEPDIEQNKGRYKYFYTYDEDTFIFGGSKAERTLDGCDTWFLELKGHGCRMLDLRFSNNGLDERIAYIDLLDFLFTAEEKYHVVIEYKRLDLALDDFTGCIKCDELESKYDTGCFTTRLRAKSKDEDTEFGRKLIKNGFTITIGGRTSRQLCIYDKKAERSAKGYDSIRDNWMRYEARWYEANAQWAFIQFFQALKDNCLTSCVCSLIGGLVEFKERLCDRKHLNEIPIWSKWDKLLNRTIPVGYQSAGIMEEHITMLKKDTWLINTPYKILTLSYLSNPSDFVTFIKFALGKGLSKLKHSELSIVNNQLKSLGKEGMSMDQARNLIIDAIYAFGGLNEIPLYLQELYYLNTFDVKSIIDYPESLPDVIARANARRFMSSNTKNDENKCEGLKNE